MEPVILAELNALRTEAGTLQDTLGAFARRLDKLVADLSRTETSPPKPADLKREDGRLTDQGVAVMEAAFAAGQTVTEIAKNFGITVSASSHRRRVWQAKLASAS